MEQQDQGQPTPETNETPSQGQEQGREGSGQQQGTNGAQRDAQGSQGQRQAERSGEHARREPEPDPRRFTQADLDKVAGNVRKETAEKTRQEAIDEFLKDLGAASREEARAGYQEYLEVSELAKTELEKAQERIKKLEEEGASKAKLAEEKAALADKRLVDSRLAVELQKAGLKPERLKIALRNVGREGLKVDGDDVSGLEEAVAALKEESEEWFQQPKKQYQAADASRGSSQPIDFRNASKEAYEAEMRKLGVKP